MDSHLISLVFSSLVFSLLLVSAQYVPSTVKAVSLATGKTNPNDVSGLNALRTRYIWLWPPYLVTEVPCLPQTWSDIECNTDVNPRVTALYLGRKDLSYPLPDFSSMDALEIIDLHGNIGLTGAIPSFLGKFPKLKVLNLANNRFSGSIPDSLACNNKLELSLAGNANLYTSSSCTTSKTESPPPPPSTRTNPNTPSDSTFESPRTNPSTPSDSTFESPRTIPGTPSGGTFESPRTNTDTRSRGTSFESPRTNTDTASSGSFEFPRMNIRKKKKNKLSIILGSTGSGVVVSCIIGGIFAIFVAEQTQPRRHSYVNYLIHVFKISMLFLVVLAYESLFV